MSTKFTVTRPILVGIAAALLAVFAADAAQAQALPKRKAGLWEIAMTGKPENPNEITRMRAEFEKVPPEKRAMMEAQMQRMGLAYPTINADGTITSHMRFCLTPEEAAEEMRAASLDKFNKRDNCDTKEISRTATELRYSSVCRGGGDAARVDMHVFGITSESWNMDVRMVAASGKEQLIKQSTRWIAADCGAVGKPLMGNFAPGRN
jgi:hypothetical protein